MKMYLRSNTGIMVQNMIKPDFYFLQSFYLAAYTAKVILNLCLLLGKGLSCWRFLSVGDKVCAKSGGAEDTHWLLWPLFSFFLFFYFCRISKHRKFKFQGLLWIALAPFILFIFLFHSIFLAIDTNNFKTIKSFKVCTKSALFSLFYFSILF